ncbi:MAG: hypothetical protein AAFQ80_07925 [Cyanobacteria bacterium J06621_8]
MLRYKVATTKLTGLDSNVFIWAKNGIFRSVSRTEFKAVVRHARVTTPGLVELTPKFRLLVPFVPQQITSKIIAQVRAKPYLEQLFYLYWNQDVSCWNLVIPKQHQGTLFCQDKNPFPSPPAIEIHSHGTTKAFFSKADDLEETGVRISTVIGNSLHQLEIVSRVCAHGAFLNISSNLIYQDINQYCHDLSL